MKNLVLLLSAVALTLGACVTEKASVYVPAKQSVEIDYPNYELFVATLKNGSKSAVDVAVLSKDNNEKVRGFGLNVKGKANVMVEAGNKLVLQNDSNAPIYLGLAVKEETPKAPAPVGSTVTFTLHNTSGASIPLLIPSVMNPNLSPFSKSGVELDMGQKILFKVNGKKYTLLTVDASIEEGAVIDVPKLLKQRKKELGLK